MNMYIFWRFPRSSYFFPCMTNKVFYTEFFILLFHIYYMYATTSTIPCMPQWHVVLLFLLILIFSCVLARHHYLYPFMISFCIRHVAHHTTCLFISFILSLVIAYLALSFALPWICRCRSRKGYLMKTLSDAYIFLLANGPVSWSS